MCRFRLFELTVGKQAFSFQIAILPSLTKSAITVSLTVKTVETYSLRNTYIKLFHIVSLLCPKNSDRHHHVGQEKSGA